MFPSDLTGLMSIALESSYTSSCFWRRTGLGREIGSWVSLSVVLRTEFSAFIRRLSSSLTDIDKFQMLLLSPKLALNSPADKRFSLLLVGHSPVSAGHSTFDASFRALTSAAAIHGGVPSADSSYELHQIVAVSSEAKNSLTDFFGLNPIRFITFDVAVVSDGLPSKLAGSIDARFFRIEDRLCRELLMFIDGFQQQQMGNH